MRGAAIMLGGAWATLFVVAAQRWRPAPGRVRALVPATRGLCIRGRRSPRDSAAPLTERLGAWTLRLARRRRAPPDPLTARRVGTALVAAAVLLPLFPPAALGGALLGWVLPSLREGRAGKRRLAALAADLPDTVDLLTLAVGAGLTVRLAIEAVGRRGGGPLAAELRRISTEVELGRRLGDALDDVPERAGEALRPLVTALSGADRYGSPLAASLERLAGEVRRDRRRQAEEAARRVPVKLLFPLVLCTLPAFALLTVAPLIASAVRSLHV